MDRDASPVRPRPRAHLTPSRTGDRVAAISPDADGLVVAWTSERDGDRCRVVRYAPEPVLISELTVSRPPDFVQRLPGGRLLLVNERSEWSPEDGPETNAVVYAPDGARTHAGTLGDGISDVRATPSGHIYVSYFDEGIFGNAGWGGVGPEPIGRTGLVRFDGALAIDWLFPETTEPPIDDCYAMNLDGETCWIYYYTDFPVARVSGDTITTWECPVEGAHSLLVDGRSGRAALAGVDDEEDLVSDGNLRGGRYEEVARRRIVLPTEGERTYVSGGSAMHIVADDEWYTLDLDALA